MPFLLPLLGLFGITAAVFGGERLASNVPAAQPTRDGQAQLSIPWYVTGTVVAVGGFLLYKYGSKKLHL